MLPILPRIMDMIHTRRRSSPSVIAQPDPTPLDLSNIVFVRSFRPLSHQLSSAPPRSFAAFSRSVTLLSYLLAVSSLTCTPFQVIFSLRPYRSPCSLLVVTVCAPPISNIQASPLRGWTSVVIVPHDPLCKSRYAQLVTCKNSCHPLSCETPIPSDTLALRLWLLRPFVLHSLLCF